MTFAIGLTISFIILSLFIYVLPIISNKISLSVLLIITTLAFVLSSLMANLYSPLIGIGIFLLLIGSLSLLIGKKRMWLETTTNKKASSSRRKRFKELSVIEGTNLENLSSVDDHMLYHKSKDDHFVESQSPQSVIDLKGMHSEINLGEYEVAASIDELIYNDATNIDVDEIREEKALYLLDSDHETRVDTHVVSTDDLSDDELIYKDETNIDVEEVMEDKTLYLFDADENNKGDTHLGSTDDLSDQWLEKRLQSLFKNEKISDNDPIESSFESISDLDNSRYEDLSEGYFDQNGSGINGSKE